MFSFLEGETILIDKPLNWTSFDVVKKIRGIVRIKKVGHAGTLDPLATGLLVVCTGKHTKRISLIQDAPKEYIAEVTFGQTTPSFDLETEFDQEFPTEHITLSLVALKLKDFIGDIEQFPPIYSAIKVDGKRSYDRARSGEDFKLKSRAVSITEIEIIDFTLPKIILKINCSKGTYIRSLAHDIGKAVDSGAHLSGLRRTAIGELVVNDSHSIESFKEKVENEVTNNSL
jgi:tRNA pseudouridine55 synthase